MIKSFKELCVLVVLPLLTLLTGCNSDNAFLSTAKLERIDIVASPVTTKGVSKLTIAAGNKLSFEAAGHYTDGSTRPLTDLNWHADDIVHFDSDVLIGGKPGTTTVTASVGDVTSNPINVTVTAAVITDITVTPATVSVAKGQAEQLTAMATYSDGTSSDETSSVTWMPADTNTATVTSSGLLSGIEMGSTTLTATKDGIISNKGNVTVTAAVITDITVTPATISVAKGQTEQLTATATYSDGTSSDVTDSVTWMLVDASTARVTSSGLLSGKDVGSTTLTATKDDIISNKGNVTVTAAVITDITVTPATVSVAKGQTEQLTAMATYSDGTSSDVTSSVTWMPADTNTATVTSLGLLTGIEVGSTTLTATKDGIISNTGNVTVTAAVITDITVTPAMVSVAKGQTEQLTAMVTYSDGTFSDVTDSVTWMLVDTNTATVTSLGLLSGVEVGSTTLTATKDGIISNTGTVIVTTAVITDITVTPATVSVAKGQTEQLTAMATYSDGTSSDVTSSVTWMPVDANTATVTSSGLLSGIEMGSTTLTATKDGIISNTGTVIVTTAVITDITVTPATVSVAKGQTEQLMAMATYSDGSSSDETSSVTWMPADTNTTTVTSSGLLSGIEAGSTTLTATKDGIISNTGTVIVTTAVITDITVTPATVSVAKGQTEQLMAMATYSDGSSSDETSSVTWMPADANTATVTSSGLLTGIEVGSTTLTATKDGIISNTGTVIVTTAVITDITVTPATVSVAKGQTEQLTAIATYSDGTSSDVTSSVTWIPVDTNTATVTSSGLLSGIEAGSTTLTATKDGIISNTGTVIVTTAVITDITVTPATVSVAKGQTEQLMAMATYSDGSSSDETSSVTWMPADTNTATVTSSGLLTGIEVGSTTLTATKDGIISNTGNVTVTAAVITDITVSPARVDIVKGEAQQLIATATYSDMTLSDISSLVTWTLVDTSYATVTSGGLLSAVEVGNTTLTASIDGVTSNTMNVTVCANLAGVCIDIFDTGNGKLITNSPSVSYLDSIGGVATNGVYREGGGTGPVGDFYEFNWFNADALCASYNINGIGGRTNWRLATKDELDGLYSALGNMSNARGWATWFYFWSATADGSRYFVKSLTNGRSDSYNPSNSTRYASCISEP
ncbi:Ig-like domain-containing protein [Vibrio mediterranei]|uniref:BIG2 domain-containing protein n=1 Tax=Vibrio mediterranei TaxID=689 RepID=A0AAN1FMG9_9VIBR|nr:Ig-like domain-containing protein [Vibrio mediterranei]ASI93362.1 hypothetical protein BSZ05_25210 [Vibrio mediterranei]